jgi:hypothetical protein
MPVVCAGKAITFESKVLVSLLQAALLTHIFSFFNIYSFTPMILAPDHFQHNLLPFTLFILDPTTHSWSRAFGLDPIYSFRTISTHIQMYVSSFDIPFIFHRSPQVSPGATSWCQAFGHFLTDSFNSTHHLCIVEHFTTDPGFVNKTL